MRILLSTLGSGGDINPYVAIARALRARGHEPILLLNPHFAPRAAAAGLEVVPFGTEDEYLAAIKGADLVHPTRGPRFVVEHLVSRAAPDMYHACRRLIRERRIDLVLRHLIAFGAGWAARAEGVPCAVGVLAPLFWMSVADPSAFKRSRIEDPPRWLVRFRFRLGVLVGRFFFDPPVNRIRKSLGLPPMRDVLPNEFLGGDLSLGLWSPHYRPPAADDPPHGRICGFTWFDQQDAAVTLDPDLDRFVSSGEPPVVFTLGTSVIHHAGDFYRLAVEACTRLGRRAVLLTGSPDNTPRDLPPTIHACPYAPFSALLHRAAATVHHGGIGTTAQGLRSGRPTVIIPFANDEFDNAARAKRLGVSRTLHLPRLSGRSLAETLDAVLTDPHTASRAAALRPPLVAEDGASCAATALEGAHGAHGGASRLDGPASC